MDRVLPEDLFIGSSTPEVKPDLANNLLRPTQISDNSRA